MRVSRGGGAGGPDPPPEKSQNIGFLSNTGQDRATKPAINVGPPSALQRNAIKWRFVGGPMMASSELYLDHPFPSSTKKQLYMFSLGTRCPCTLKQSLLSKITYINTLSDLLSKINILDKIVSLSYLHTCKT